MILKLGKDDWGEELTWDGSPNLHICITGDSGSGKSFWLKTIIPQAARQGAKVVVFDTQGDMSEVDCSAFPGWASCSVQVVNICDSRYHLEIFQPCLSRETPEDIAERLAGLFAPALHLGDSQRALLCEFLFKGLASGSYRTLSDLLEDIKIEAEENDVAKRLVPKMQSICRRIPSGELPFPWDTSTPGILIINMQSILDPKNQSILMELMTGEISGKKMTKRPSEAVEQPPLIFIFDECQRLSMKSGTMIERLLREGRKYGNYGWFSTQWAKKEDLKPLGQAGLKIFFRTQTDIEAANIAVSQMGIQEPEKKARYRQIITNLRIGEYLVLLGKKIHRSCPIRSDE